jgi:outer membrane lipoprotein SlyB
MQTSKIGILGILILSGCATATGWTPTVDTYGDPNAFRLNQDMSECQQLATQASGGTAQETAVGAGVGGLIGAAGGAALGAALGNAGTGAAIGAAAGGIGGGAKQGLESDANYKRAYSNCLRQRGHKVIN